MIIDADYYLNTYKGEDPDDDVLLEKLISRADDDINGACLWNLDDIDNYGTMQKSLLQKATAAQVEFYVMNGETYNNGGSDSVSIGKYSYSGTNVNGVRIADRASSYLEHTGLLFRGVDCGRTNTD